MNDLPDKPPIPGEHALALPPPTSEVPVADQVPAESSPASTTATSNNSLSKRKARRRWAFRLIAIGLSLLPFVLLEILCRLFGGGLPTEMDDPFVGFSDIHPLFVLNEESGHYEISPSRTPTFFCPESFESEKPEDQFRIFVLGGSTVQGRPYEKETSFTSWLQISLNVAEPNRRWRVINCGGISYASYRLIPILREVLDYDPDMIIICTGHNEFLEDRSYAHVRDMPKIIAWPTRQVSQLRTYNLLRAGVLWFTREGKDQAQRDIPKLPAEVDARLDFKGGIEKYHRNEVWRTKVMAHFAFNLQQMTAITRRAKIPLMFVVPVAKLDWPPFKSQHREDISTDEQARFESLLRKARAAATPAEALDFLTSARAIDDRFALVHFLMGRKYREVGRLRKAKRAFARALEEDICPLRMLAPMRKDMVATAKLTNTPLVNLQIEFEARSPGGITGNRWLIDHVHPTIKGHQLVAKILVGSLEKQGAVHLESGWSDDIPQAYEEHFAWLRKAKPAYSLDAKRRLEGVLRWGFGNVTLERKEPGIEEQKENGR